MEEYVVQVKDGIIIGSPILKSSIQPPMQTIGMFMPCNYGEYRPGLDLIGSGEIKGDIVVYLIMPTPDDLIIKSVKKRKEKEIRIIGEEKLRAIAGGYRQTERETWSYQASEAAAFLINPEAPTPIIDAIALNRGITKEDLVSKVMENSNLFMLASGTLLGMQQKFLDMINNAITVEEVESIVWS